MKNNYDHTTRKNTVMVSPFMERMIRMASEEAGRNRNNQVRLSHGMQVLALRYAKSKGVNTEKLYPNINH